jgi:hypothetical protein
MNAERGRTNAERGRTNAERDRTGTRAAGRKHEQDRGGPTCR